MNENLLATAHVGQPVVKKNRGHILVVFVYEVGDEVSLDEASSLLEGGPGQSRPEFSPGKHQPEFFGYRPRPLRVVKSCGEFRLGDFLVQRTVEITVWAVGVVSVEYKIIIAGDTSLEGLCPLTTQLAEDIQLEADARQQVTLLVKTFESAIKRPLVPAIHEDYVVVVIEEFTETIEATLLSGPHGQTLTRLLRQKGAAVNWSAQVISDALKCSFSHTATDLTVIDWNVALVYGAGLEHIVDLLEIVQVQLLELRYLDYIVEEQMREVYRLSEEAEEEYRRHMEKGTAWFGALKATARATLAQVGLGGQDKVDYALALISMYSADARRTISSVENAINLYGHPTLFLINAMAAECFGLSDLAKQVEEKVESLDKVYEKISDKKESHRGVFLEIIVILLILIEVLMSVFSHH